MNVRSMQKIDFWAGVPLCLGLSIVNSIRKLFQPDPPKFAGGRVLCIELSEIGSTILAHSALELLKTKVRAGLYFVIFEKNAGAVEVMKVIPKENIITIDDRGFVRFVRSAVKALLRIRRLKPEATVDFELFSRFTAMFAFLTGAHVRAGFSNHTNEGLYRGNLLTHAVLYNPHRHMALNLLALAQGVDGIEDGCFVKKDTTALLLDPPRTEISAQRLAVAAELIRAQLRTPEQIELVLLSPDPGPALPLRGWDPGNYIEVAKALLAQDPRIAVGIIGLASSRSLAMRIRDGIGQPGRTADFTGATEDLEVLLALFRLAKLLIATDGGSAHLASLTSLPSIVLFGPETPALYAPLGDGVTTLFAGIACSPCLSAANHRRSDCTNNRCLQAISPAQVLAEARRKLGVR